MATRALSQDLTGHGLCPRGPVHWNLAPAELCEHALRRGEGILTADGAFTAITRPHTGRSPNDKFLVREPSSEDEIGWGAVNVPLEAEHFRRLHHDLLEHLEEQELFVRDVFAGADPAHRLNVRVMSSSAWHSLFVHNMFLEPLAEERENFEPGVTVLHAPRFTADPGVHGTRSGTFIVLHFGERLVLIGGTAYAGEIKKSIFSVLNYLLPHQGVLPMHCSANAGDEGEVALFFGLSGTGKTTLSTDPARHLIGDDEHGWSDRGIFNFEGGNYAKVIRLSQAGEPLIYAASRRFGAILENVVVDPVTREVDFDDGSITENTRSSYPLSFIEGAVPTGRGAHPRHVVFLAADAFGVLPPLSKLTLEQAMYHFLSGYTAKVAGTERGVMEPKATFSTCFGAPFLPLQPAVYARLLGERIVQHKARCWLVNTGWTGGPYGVGQRMNLQYTREMIHAALSGKLDSVPSRPDRVFGLRIPEHVPGVPAQVLEPRPTWADPAAYDALAAKLASMFRENFQQFAAEASPAVRAAGP
ncbi:MAG: phosphoenolpyruvate carboxykinase (ATP) [Gemmatimonadetes bacterium]|nr:phosphoenolpyruvate carboxykinase (ATP) [Gemmatimonadota bacterium]